MSHNDQEEINIVGKVIAITERAVLLDITAVEGEAEEHEGVWIPKSQIQLGSDDYEDSEVGEEVEYLIPEWLADEKDLLG
jgi:hypothetical protein